MSIIEFNNMINNISLGDSYELIKIIPDNSVDLVIIDPPYKIETRGGGLYKETKFYDEIRSKGMADGLKNELLDELERVMKKTNIYIFCSKKQLLQYLEYYKSKNYDLLVWNKTNPLPTINNKYLSDLEYIVFARDKGVKMYNEYKTSSKLFVTGINRKDKLKYNHPTVKPIEIIKRLIFNSSKEGDIILDCFSGSGTTCVAAKEMKRKYIGIEIDEAYYRTSLERLNGDKQTTIDELK